jgi:hypothetical protein
VKRAPGTCSTPGCAGVPVYRGQCPAHVQWHNGQRERGRRLMRRRARLTRERGARCELCRRPGPLELHHLDGNPTNDEDRNLRLVCSDCHAELTREQHLEVYLETRRSSNGRA